MSKPTYDNLLKRLVDHDHEISIAASKTTVAGGGGGSSSSSSTTTNNNGKNYATVVVAPVGRGLIADYYTDGTADDVEINAAITVVQALGGGRVLLLTGSYLTTSSIFLGSNVILEGEGNETLITITGTGAHVIRADSVDNIQIRNLKVDGNKSVITTDTHGLRIHGCDRVTLYNLYVTNTVHHGINTDSCTDVVIDSCYASFTGVGLGTARDGVGIIAGADAINVRIINCTTFMTGYHGIQVYTGTKQVFINDCHVSYPGQTTTSGDGIKINPECEDVHIANSYFGYGPANGFHTATDTGAINGVIISHCTFEFFQLSGIEILGVTDVVVSNNTIRNNGQAATVTVNYGVRLAEGTSSFPTKNVNIIGNNIYDNQATATQKRPVGVFDATTDEINIEGNQFHGHLTADTFNLDKTFAGNYKASGNMEGSTTNITLNGMADNTLASGRNYGGTDGKQVTLQGGAAGFNATNAQGGNLDLIGGIPTGSGTSNIRLKAYTATTNDLTSLKSITLKTRGSGYAVSDILTVSGGGGSGATITVTSVALAGQIQSAAIHASPSLNYTGTGYTVNDVLTVTGGGGAGGTLTVLAVDSSGRILLTTVTTGGSGYVNTTSAATTGGTGTGAIFDITIYATGAVLGNSLTTAGTGYSLTVGAATTGGGGSGATYDIVPFGNSDSTSSSVVLNVTQGAVAVTGKVNISSYLRVGSSTAPNNTTAGDLTSVRLAVGNTALSAANGEIANFTGSITDTSGTVRAIFVAPTFTPASNSSATFNAMAVDAIWNPAAGVTQTAITALYSQTRIRGTGLIATLIGQSSTAMLVDSSSPATVQATNVYAISPAIYSRSSGTSTATITTGVGYDTSLLASTAGLTITTLTGFRMSNPAGNTITTLLGMDIASLTVGSANIALRIAEPSGGTGTSNYAIQLTGTSGRPSSGITFGTDTNLYRSAANVLKTDDSVIIDYGGSSGTALTVQREAGVDVGTATGIFLDVINTGYSGGAIGLDVDNITGNGANIGVRIAAPSGGSSNLALQLSDTGGTASGGLTFGSDTNLYRSAADRLHTDDDFDVASGKVYKVNNVQVVAARVIDARCDDAINSGDATTDGVIDSLRDAMITHGLIAAA